MAPHSAFLVQKIIFQQILGGNRQRQESFLSESQALLFSNDAPYFFKSCGNFSTGQRGREWVVADGHHLFCVLYTDLAMGKGPHYENNWVTTGHQLSNVTDVLNRKGSANFHTANWEVVRHWILNYLKTKRRVSPRTGPRTHQRVSPALPSKASEGRQLLGRSVCVKAEP